MYDSNRAGVLLHGLFIGLRSCSKSGSIESIIQTHRQELGTMLALLQATKSALISCDWFLGHCLIIEMNYSVHVLLLSGINS